MLSWRGKLLLLLIVYLGGFATAIYCLAPPANTPREALAADQSNPGTKASDRLLQAINLALHRGKNIGLDLVDRAYVLVQHRYPMPPNTDPKSQP